MDKTRLVSLLEKYRQGECTEEEKELLGRWLDKMNEITGNEKSFRSEIEAGAMERRIWNSVNHKPKGRKNYRIIGSVMKYAAILAGIVYTLYLLTPASFHPVSAAVKWDTVRTDQNILTVKLSDGSVLSLNTGTTVRYPEEFGKKQRVVELIHGEAIFDVKPDSLKPFLVLAQGVTTKVLGTRFTVTSYESLGNVNVRVEHGKVKVTDSLQTLGLLTQNQSLNYDLTSHLATPGENTAWFDPERQAVLLNHCSYAEFSVRIESAYGYKIIAGKDEVLQYFFTGEILFNEPFHTTIQKFAAIHGSHIVFKGKEVYMY